MPCTTLPAILLGLALRVPAAAPPQFERTADAATDGQTVRQPAAPRRQVVSILPDRTSGRASGLRYLREAVEDLGRVRPDAVFCVGDLVQGYSRDHAHVTSDRDEYLAIVERLAMPFYPTPGNHDLVSGARDAGDRSFAEEYRRRFGPLYYAVELELASIVVLNTEDGDGAVQPGFSDAQLAWLDATLARLEARGRPIVLLFHRPLWDHAATRWNERVQPLLVTHGVDYVIAGHYHAMQMLPPRDGIPFLLLGTCGGAIDQHPLAGQLQHVTHLVIEESGAIHPYHQIAGTTLPDDWITKPDQDLAYRLKTERDVVTVRGAIADPVGRPVEGSVEVVVRNPLDRPIEVRFAPTSRPSPWLVEDRGPDGPIERVWTSRTPIDVFNPRTTDLDGPFDLALPQGAASIAPGSSASFRLDASCAAQGVPPQPAPFDVEATFADSKGRRVPIVLRQRLPIARRIAVASSLEAALDYPIAVWRWSEYDTPEENSRVRFARPSAPEDPAATDPEVLRIAVDVPDERLSDDAKPSDRRTSLDDPLGDGVRVAFGEDAEAREFLVTFADGGPRVRALARDGRTLAATDALSATMLAAGEGRWRLVIRVRRSALPEGARLAELPVNVGVADNDETYHTQWRWLAPKQLPARLAP